MDWTQVEGNWKQMKGRVKERWGRLTDSSLRNSRPGGTGPTRRAIKGKVTSNP